MKPEEIRIAQVTQEPRELPAQVPKNLANVVLKALAKEPGKRWQSCDELRDALKTALAGEDAVGWRWRTRNSVRRHAVSLAIVAGLVLLGVAGAIWNESNRVAFC